MFLSKTAISKRKSSISRSNRGISNPQITYQDPGSGQKFVYRIVCKEDVEDQNNQQEIESSSNESSDDEDEGQFGYKKCIFSSKFQMLS